MQILNRIIYIYNIYIMYNLIYLYIYVLIYIIRTFDTEAQASIA